MSSVYCLRSEEPLQELAWGCSPGAVRQVYGKLLGDLLQQQQLLTPFPSQSKVPGMMCSWRRAGWLGCLPRLQGGSWPKRQSDRNVFPSLAAGSFHFLSGNTSTELSRESHPRWRDIPDKNRAQHLVNNITRMFLVNN